MENTGTHTPPVIGILLNEVDTETVAVAAAAAAGGGGEEGAFNANANEEEDGEAMTSSTRYGPQSTSYRRQSRN